LTLDGTATGSVSLALSGDTAVVSRDGVVQVLEREPGGDHWLHSTTLSAGTSGFGKSVATDGRTTAVGSNVFQRPSGQAWEEVARLASDTNTASFGVSVAVSGTTIVVGAPSSSLGRGLVFVFEEDEDGEAPGVRSRGWPVSRFPGARSPTISVRSSRLTPIL